jgi:4-amino-4-deoxychorismate lyase
MSSNNYEIISIKNLNEDDLVLLSTGQGFLETLKYTRNTLWFKELHYSRLQNSAKLFNIDICPSRLNNAVKEKINLNGKNNSYRIRIILLFSFIEKHKSTGKIIIQLLPFNLKTGHDKDYSLTMQISPSTNNPLAKYKSINFGPAFFKKQEAVNSGFNDVLFYNEKNELLEASTSNIFGVRGGKLYTPPLSDSILPGTIRQLLIENMNVKEKEIPVSKIESFDYFFLTNSIAEIQPVKKIDAIQFKIEESGFSEILLGWERIKNKYLSK